MRGVAIIAIAFSGCVLAQAATNPTKSLFGNTLSVTGPEGTTLLWYKPDKTFDGSTDKGEVISGTWEYEDGKICSFILRPAPRPKHCGNMAVHNIGDKWDDVRANGDVVHLALLRGTHR